MNHSARTAMASLFAGAIVLTGAAAPAAAATQTQDGLINGGR